MPASSLSIKTEGVRESDSGDVKNQRINSRVKMDLWSGSMMDSFMPTITRRNFLGSLTLGTIYPDVERTIASELQAADWEKLDSSAIRWSIAKKSLVAGLDHLDFWSKPFLAMRCADKFSSEIGLCALFNDETDELTTKPGRILTDWNSLTNERAYLNDRFCIERGTGIKALKEFLKAEVDGNAKTGSARTTALIALASQWATGSGPDWGDILSAFRGCYDRLIGHYHIDQRGFHHWKNSMIEGMRLTRPALSDFSQARLCNATRLFSRAKALSKTMCIYRRGLRLKSWQENYCSALRRCCWTTRSLVRSYRCALQTSRRKASASRTWPTVAPADLLRQRELTFSSFGKPILRPLIIGLSQGKRISLRIEGRSQGRI